MMNDMKPRKMSVDRAVAPLCGLRVLFAMISATMPMAAGSGRRLRVRQEPEQVLPENRVTAAGVGEHLVPLTTRPLGEEAQPATRSINCITPAA
jgi:hypothetical protein